MLGSHSLQCSKSVAKSVHNSKIRQKTFGHGEPPKVSLRLGRANRLCIIAHISAVSPCRLTHLYAPLKSDLPPKIGTKG
jgi:hypothetical protein